MLLCFLGGDLRTLRKPTWTQEEHVKLRHDPELRMGLWAWECVVLPIPPLHRSRKDMVCTFITPALFTAFLADRLIIKLFKSWARSVDRREPFRPRMEWKECKPAMMMMRRRIGSVKTHRVWRVHVPVFYYQSLHTQALLYSVFIHVALLTIDVWLDP